MTGEAHPRIHTLSIWWNRFQTSIKAYLIRGEVPALIDTGPPQTSGDTIHTALQSLRLTPADIDLVLHTHGHSDHIGGNALVKMGGRARFMIHREDAVFLEDHALCFDRYHAPLIKALGGEQNLQREREAFLNDAGPELTADRHLEDNDRIDIGEGVTLLVLHLPGHSPGSAGFYWEKEGILFTGDSMPGLSTPNGSLPILYDLAAYQKSIDRLAEMPLRYVLSTHPYRGLHLPPSTVRQGKEIRQYLHDSREMVRRLREAVQLEAAEGKDRPLLQSADRIIGELPSEMGFRPIAELPVPQFSLSTVFWSLSQMKRS